MLSPDGDRLYWQAIKGETLYRIATDALEDGGMSAWFGAAAASLTCLVSARRSIAALAAIGRIVALE